MDAFKFLQTLFDQPLCYGLKSPDTDLYDFGLISAIVGLYLLHLKMGRNLGDSSFLVQTPHIWLLLILGCIFPNQKL